jgi:tRNA(Ile2) C34 agmatinyltransferase TiaS
MKFIVSIDDTDNLESFSTGIIAEKLASIIENELNYKCTPVVRHQLLLDDRVRYTSHNSAMSFTLDGDEQGVEKIIKLSINFLKENHAPESDPGLCVVDVDKLKFKDELISFGFRTKKQLISMDEAYEMARKTGVHLSAHGGTGEGIIGALAGAGLRLSGNDGKFRGTINIGINSEEMSVKTLLTHKMIDEVQDIHGNIIDEKQYIHIKDRIKTVYSNAKSILLVKRVTIDEKQIWANYSIQELKNLGK